MGRDRRSRLLQEMGERTTEGPLPERLCRAAAPILGMDGATLLLVSEGVTDVHVIASTDANSPEDPQFALGEGPCFDAFTTGEAVLVGDLSSGGGRWPILTPDVVHRGVRSASAFPLRVGAIRIGVLYLYRSTPGELSDDQLADGYALAEIATWILLEMQSGAEPGELGQGLDADWHHRAVVHQATGIISARLDVPLGEALARIRAAAFVEGRSSHELAGDIVAGRKTIER